MWDERYRTDEYVYGTAPNDFLVRHGHLIPKGKVLCLAEGEGRNAVFLARQGYEVTAVDLSSVGLKKVRRQLHSQVNHAFTGGGEANGNCRVCRPSPKPR